MDVLGFMNESLIESFKSIYKIIKIVMPLMIFIEILKDYKILDMVSERLSPISKVLGISKKSTLPLVVGLILGLSYGAGVIIQSAKEGELTKKDLYLLIIFLVACHSVFEDTLLFVVIGANGWVLLTIRVLTAFILTALAAKHIDKLLVRQAKEGENTH